MVALSVGYEPGRRAGERCLLPFAAYFPLLTAFWPLPPDGPQAL